MMHAEKSAIHTFKSAIHGFELDTSYRITLGKLLASPYTSSFVICKAEHIEPNITLRNSGGRGEHNQIFTI